MNRIILVRHGEPDLLIDKKISGSEILSFLARYDTAALKSTSLPSSQLQYLSHNATVLCSPLMRSLCSAKKCGVSPDIVDSLFKESIPPHFRNNFLKLSPKGWLLISRLLWMGGFSLHGESLMETRRRAEKAAGILVEEAKRKDAILFGHGLFNIMIAGALKKRGYRGPKVPARNFWEYGIYSIE